MGKDVTLSALMTVGKTESGIDLVQVMPDNPCGGQVQPFHGRGYGQMLGNGCFDFVRRPRKRKKPELKLPHGTVSFGDDGYDRFIFVLPSDQRQEFPKLLRSESSKAAKFMDKRLDR